MTKQFYGKCGMELFSLGSRRSGIVSIKAGTIDDPDVMTSSGTVFVSSKIPVTSLDDRLEQFKKIQIYTKRRKFLHVCGSGP